MAVSGTDPVKADSTQEIMEDEQPHVLGHEKYPKTLKGRLRLYWLTAIICMGGFLFGYDSGVVGGVLEFEHFQKDFGIHEGNKTSISSIAVGIQQAGALVGCFAVWPITKKIGRRWTIVICAVIFDIGVILELIKTHSIDCFYVGRVICGLGMGGASTIIPIYLSEMAPKEDRGRLGSCYQLLYTIGIMISYWVDWGTKDRDNSAQWQIPIAMQMVPCTVMGLGMFTLHESVRWLLSSDKHEDAWNSLTWIRGSEEDHIKWEFDEIQEGIISDRHAMAGFSLKELLEWPNSRRLLLGFSIFLCQQSTGATALAYFGPQFFTLLVGEGDKNIMLSGIFGAVKFVSCLIFVIFIAERFGRKPLLLSGSFFMSACMITTAAVVKTHQPPGDGVVTSSGIATVALIYLNIIVYNASWGPLPWPCTSEIFPTRIREPGVATGVAGQWLFNFVYSFSTPYMMDAWGWGTFLFYGIVDIFCAAFVYLCLKETKNMTLEQINAMYDPKQYQNTISAKRDSVEHVEHT